jgi:hypothetical protein
VVDLAGSKVGLLAAIDSLPRWSEHATSRPASTTWSARSTTSRHRIPLAKPRTPRATSTGVNVGASNGLPGDAALEPFDLLVADGDAINGLSARERRRPERVPTAMRTDRLAILVIRIHGYISRRAHARVCTLIRTMFAIGRGGTQAPADRQHRGADVVRQRPRNRSMPESGGSRKRRSARARCSPHTMIRTMSGMTGCGRTLAST